MILDIKDVSLSGFSLTSVALPFSITQCTTFSGVAGNCSTSLFQIEDVAFSNAEGTETADPIASLQCSAAAPCTNITITGMDLSLTNGTVASGYNCNALVNPIGFNCTGSTCLSGSATGVC